MTDGRAGVLIEEGTTNLIPLAKQNFEGWTAYQGAVVTLTQNVAVPEWGATDATRIQTSGGTSVAKYLFNVGVVPAGELRAERVWGKNTGDKTVKVFANFSDIAADVLPGESKLVKLENIIGNDVNNLQISFRTLTIADSLDFIAWRPMAEQKPKQKRLPHHGQTARACPNPSPSRCCLTRKAKWSLMSTSRR